MKKFTTSFYIFGLAICLMGFTPCFAQNSKHNLKITHQVETFFKGLNAKDTLIIKSTLASDVHLKSMLIKDEDEQLVSENIEEFLKQIGRLPDDLHIYEKIENIKISVRFPLADVFMDYTFYVNDEESHHGINLFTLIYINETWKILNIVDTRE